MVKDKITESSLKQIIAYLHLLHESLHNKEEKEKEKEKKKLSRKKKKKLEI